MGVMASCTVDLSRCALNALTSTVTTFKGSANGHLQKLASVPTPWFLAANCTAEGKSRAIATDLATSLSSLRAALNALPTKGSNFGPEFPMRSR
eukprot:1156785-Pelagomonas_calceolata.AAC.8